MFTGIVQGVATVVSLTEKENARSFTLAFEEGFCQGITIGASVAVNGTCLTVVAKDEEKDQLSFDTISTTLALTNLSELTLGSRVNVERSFRVGAEIGGHIISGHVDAKVPIKAIVNSNNIYQIEFACPEELRKYLVDKGFIGLDGMSLTISSLTEEGFTVNLIPETLAKTTIGEKALGNLVNLEIDNNTKVIVKTLENYLANNDISKLIKKA